MQERNSLDISEIIPSLPLDEHHLRGQGLGSHQVIPCTVKGCGGGTLLLEHRKLSKTNGISMLATVSLKLRCASKF